MIKLRDEDIDKQTGEWCIPKKCLRNKCSDNTDSGCMNVSLPEEKCSLAAHKSISKYTLIFLSSAGLFVR